MLQRSMTLNARCRQTLANDPNVTLGIYTAKDCVVKDAGGLIAANYSFRVDPDKRFQSIVKAKTVNGVLQTQAPTKLTIRDFWGAGGFPEQLILEEAQLKFSLNKDGSLSGLIGGYRDWFDHYRGSAGNGRTTTGGIPENLGHYSLVG